MSFNKIMKFKQTKTECQSEENQNIEQLNNDGMAGPIPLNATKR